MAKTLTLDMISKLFVVVVVAVVDTIVFCQPYVRIFINGRFSANVRVLLDEHVIPDLLYLLYYPSSVNDSADRVKLI